MNDEQSKVSFTMVCCEDTLLREIAMKEMKQRDIAQTYRLAMESDERTTINWKAVNEAIIARWSVAGMVRIKEMAHSGKCFAPKV